MPERSSAPNARISGEDILNEILRNMEEGTFRIRGTAIVPAIYRVYLHADEFEPLRGALPFLTSEIEKALDEQLSEWNGSTPKPLAFLKKLGGQQSSGFEYKKIPPQWTIELLPDVDGSLQRGEIEIHSELGAPPKMEYGSGELTRRIVKNPAGSFESAPTVSHREPSGAGIADLRYSDNLGTHTYEMTRSEIVLGRGGKAYWVDIKLDTLPDISREHCRIRHDTSTGKFYLKDTSQFGTTINGTAVPKDEEVALPKKARIGLADIVFIEFEGK